MQGFAPYFCQNYYLHIFNTLTKIGFPVSSFICVEVTLLELEEQLLRKKVLYQL